MVTIRIKNNIRIAINIIDKVMLESKPEAILKETEVTAKIKRIKEIKVSTEIHQEREIRIRLERAIQLGHPYIDSHFCYEKLS